MNHHFKVFFLSFFFSFWHNAQGQEIDLNAIEILQENQTWETYMPAEIGPVQGDFQLRLKIPEEVKTENLSILYLDELQEVEVFVDSVSFGKTGVLLPLSRRKTPTGLLIHSIGNSVQERVVIKPASQYIYLKVYNKFEKEVQAKFKLYSPAEWQETVSSSREKTFLIQGLMGGALLLITLYHLLIYITRRDIPYLHYAIYTGLIFFVLGNETGLIQATIFTEYQFEHNFIVMCQVLSLFSSALYFIFMRSFIDLKSLLPKLDKFISWYLWIVVSVRLLVCSAYFFGLKRAWLSMSYVSAMATLTVGLISVILILRTKNKLAYYFTFGSLVLYVFVMSTTILSLLEFNGIITPISFDRIYLSEIGIMIEIIIFSLGLGYRMRMQENEKSQLEDLANLKTKFFTNISHEFRTPLTVITGMTDQIKGHHKEKELIQRNSSSLLNLVNQLLDLSKLDTSNMSLDMVQGDIIPFLRYLTESFYSMANDKGIRLTFYTEVETQVIDFDESKIQQVIFNLVRNAIKFTGEGGKVIIHINKPSADRIRIKVKDTGVGISAEELENVFNRFYQKPTSHEIGTGIGLSLTKELVNLMQGEISVTSQEGIGSEFIVELPITQKADLQDFVFEPIYHNYECRSEVIDPLDDSTMKPLILLVEDNSDITTYVKSILAKDYAVIIAQNGEEGVAMAQRHIPDAILSDVMMPKLSGFELCRIVKSTESTNHIPIILLTAKHTSDDKLSGLSTGADDYITKPFDRKELLLKIKNILKLREQIQNEYSGGKGEPKPQDQFMSKVVSYITRNIANPDLSVNSLSFELKLSKMQVNRKIKALTGQAPAAYITTFRMEKALLLLEQGTFSIAEIAYAVGYSDPNYFSRAFTKKYGIVPREVKKPT